MIWFTQLVPSPSWTLKLCFSLFFLKYLWTKFFWGPNFFWQTFFWPKIKLIHQNEVNNVPVWAELGIAQPQFDINFNRNLMWHLILFLKTIITSTGSVQTLRSNWSLDFYLIFCLDEGGGSNLPYQIHIHGISFIITTVRSPDFRYITGNFCNNWG